MLGLELNLLGLNQNGEGNLANALDIPIQQVFLELDVAASGSIELYQHLILGSNFVLRVVAIKLGGFLEDFHYCQLIIAVQHHRHHKLRTSHTDGGQVKPIP